MKPKGESEIGNREQKTEKKTRCVDAWNKTQLTVHCSLLTFKIDLSTYKLKINH
ncbi:MAG: hypothetical protein PHC64_06740 [Candidatus Gastranaerophilales bacterium]|nr:hypothetical protein [Candidatus Gastranaerophilales bacterium]